MRSHWMIVLFLSRRVRFPRFWNACWKWSSFISDGRKPSTWNACPCSAWLRKGIPLSKRSYLSSPSDRLLVTNYSHTTVPYRPLPPSELFLSLPASIAIFQQASDHIWSRLHEANGHLFASANSLGTPSSPLKISLPSASTIQSFTYNNNFSPRPVSATESIRPRSESMHRRSFVVQQVLKHSSNQQQQQSISSIPNPKVHSPFKPQNRVPITRGTVRSVLSVLYYILKLKDVPGLREGPVTAATIPTADLSAWKDLVVSHQETASLHPQPSQESMDEDGRRRATGSVSFREMPQVRRHSMNPESILEGSTEGVDVQPPSTAGQGAPPTRLHSLQALARRTLDKLQQRAKYEMWWEIVMATEGVKK